MPRGDDSDPLAGLASALPAGPVKQTKRAHALFNLLAVADQQLINRLSSSPKQSQMAQAAMATWRPGFHETQVGMELMVALLLDAEQRADHLYHYKDWGSSTRWWTTPMARTLASYYDLPHTAHGLSAPELRSAIQQVDVNRPSFVETITTSPARALAQAVPQTADAASVNVTAATVAMVASHDHDRMNERMQQLLEQVRAHGMAMPDDPREDFEDDYLYDARRLWIGHDHADVIAAQLLQQRNEADDLAWFSRYRTSVASYKPAVKSLRADKAVTGRVRQAATRLKSLYALASSQDPRKL